MTTTAYDLAQRYAAAAKPDSSESDWMLDEAGEAARYSADDWHKETVKGRKNPSNRRWVHRSKKGPDGKPLVVYSDTNPGGKAKPAAAPAAKPAPKPKAPEHPLSPAAEKRPAQKADEDLGKAIESVIKPKAKAEPTEAKEPPAKGKPKAEVPGPGGQWAKPSEMPHAKPKGLTGKQVDELTQARAQEHTAAYIEAYLDPNRNPGEKNPNENVNYDSDGKLRSLAVNTDEFRDLFPEYVGTNSGDVHEASSHLTKALYARALKELKGKGNETIIVLAGGGGSGKGTATNDHFDQEGYPIRLDQVSGDYKKLMEKLYASAGKPGSAEEAGWSKFAYCFVDREVAGAWDGVVFRALNGRAKGKLARTVALERATHDNIEARKVALKVFEENPELPCMVIDNNHGRNNSQKIENRDEAIKFLKKRIADEEAKLGQIEQLRENTLARFDAGEVPEDILRGLLGDKTVDSHLAKKTESKPDIGAAVKRIYDGAGKMGPDGKTATTDEDISKVLDDPELGKMSTDQMLAIAKSIGVVMPKSTPKGKVLQKIKFVITDRRAAANRAEV